jgi:hypothetical protein
VEDVALFQLRKAAGANPFANESMFGGHGENWLKEGYFS